MQKTAKNEKQGRRDRSAWRSLVDQWRASGVQAPEFARQRGLKVANLYYWSSVLGREQPKAATRLVPVQLAASAGHAVDLELLVGPARVRFPEGTAPAYVAAVARALLEAGGR